MGFYRVRKIKQTKVWTQCAIWWLIYILSEHNFLHPIDLKLFKNVKKEAMTGTLCGFCFLVSLCFAQNVGMYIFKIFDDFSGNIPLLLIALFECIGVGYFYGIRT